MKHTLVRALCTLLSLLLLASCALPMIACGTGEDDGTSSGTLGEDVSEARTESPEETFDVPKLDFGGYVFHIYCDSDKGVVYANNSMISFHTATPGQYTLHAKAPAKWTMVYPEKHAFKGKQADPTFTAAQPDTYIFIIE